MTTRTPHTPQTPQTPRAPQAQHAQQAQQAPWTPPARSITDPITDENTPVRGPWSVRLAHQPGARAALEVYEQGELLDIMVASALSSALLRGARRSTHADTRSSFAWGRLPADGAHPRVTFTSGRLKRHQLPAEVVPLAGEFWLAWAEGQYDSVLAEHPTSGVERLRAQRI